jgi:hypothetical protein
MILTKNVFEPGWEFGVEQLAKNVQHRLTPYSRFGRRAASVRAGVRCGFGEAIGSSKEAESAGHTRTTQPRRGQSLRFIRVVGRREYKNVIGN